ncbi:MAG: ROK family protein [Clostridia bacterium]|nr:ROK family protein [Clostridia bacterium]
MIYIGVDVGGTGIKVGAVDEQGNILSKVKGPTLPERGYEAMLHNIADLCILAATESGHTMADVHSVGIGLPGIYDPARKLVPICTNLNWHDVPVEQELHKYIDCPVFIDNDATVAGLAESVAGVSKGTKNSVFITLGTGVGGGIILNGKVFAGSHGVASEIGHIMFRAGGEPCTCGNRGCWERYASATAIIREGRKFAEQHPNCGIAKAVGFELNKIEARTVIDLAKAGDPDAVKIFDNYVDDLAMGLTTLINVYDPEVIVIGGGVSNTGDFLLNKLRAAYKKFVFCKNMPYATIELATLGNDAGIIGAAMLGKED